MAAQHLLEPLHHDGHAPLHRERHDERATTGRRQIRHAHLHRDELRRLLPAVEPALHQQDRVIGEQGRAAGVGGGEEQHLDRAFEVLQRGRGPWAALPGDLALHPGQDPADGDRLAVAAAARARPRSASSAAEDSSCATEQSVPLARRCSTPSRGWSETYRPSISRSNASRVALSHSPSGTGTSKVASASVSCPNSESWPYRLVALDVDHRVDRLLVNEHEALARVAERVEGTGLDQ